MIFCDISILSIDQDLCAMNRLHQEIAVACCDQIEDVLNAVKLDGVFDQPDIGGLNADFGGLRHVIIIIIRVWISTNLAPAPRPTKKKRNRLA